MEKPQQNKYSIAPPKIPRYILEHSPATAEAKLIKKLRRKGYGVKAKKRKWNKNKNVEFNDNLFGGAGRPYATLQTSERLWHVRQIVGQVAVGEQQVDPVVPKHRMRRDEPGHEGAENSCRQRVLPTVE